MEAPLKIPLKPKGAKGVRFAVLVSTPPATHRIHHQHNIVTVLWPPHSPVGANTSKKAQCRTRLLP